MKRLTASFPLAIAMLLIFTAVVLAYTLSWQLQPWVGGNYVYTITSDSALGGGEVVCVQYKSNTDGWVYHQAECTGSGTTWVCTIPGPVTGGPPPSNGYNYEFYAQSTARHRRLGAGSRTGVRAVALPTSRRQNRAARTIGSRA